jgi:hypothetical protein
MHRDPRGRRHGAIVASANRYLRAEELCVRVWSNPGLSTSESIEANRCRMVFAPSENDVGFQFVRRGLG